MLRPCVPLRPRVIIAFELTTFTVKLRPKAPGRSSLILTKAGCCLICSAIFQETL
ncbi:hypothetical protein Hanom_Chr16g01523531 [Helianthus anomalus]